MRCALVFCFLTFADISSAAEDKIPSFEDYPAKQELYMPVSVDLSSHPIARRFRTVLGEAAKAGPNFGGHLIIASWGCGTGCVQWAVVDLTTGRVYVDKKLSSLLWIPGWEVKMNERFLTYKNDSDLLILHGAVGEEAGKVTRHYLRWVGTGFEELRVETVLLSPSPRPPTAESSRH